MCTRLRAQRYDQIAKKPRILAIIHLSVENARILTFRKQLNFSDLRKSYKNTLKKIRKKDTTYQKNA